MKMIGFLAALLFMADAHAWVDSTRCPSSLSVEFKNIAKIELNSTIENDFLLKMTWEKMQAKELVSQTFNILSRSGTLCVYVGGNKALYLQTNNFLDELAIPYDNEQTTYFRLNIASFSPTHITLVKDQELDLLAPVIVIGGDSATQVGEEKIGVAASVKVQVNP